MVDVAPLLPQPGSSSQSETWHACKRSQGRTDPQHFSTWRTGITSRIAHRIGRDGRRADGDGITTTGQAARAGSGRQANGSQSRAARPRSQGRGRTARRGYRGKRGAGRARSQLAHAGLTQNVMEHSSRLQVARVKSARFHAASRWGGRIIGRPSHAHRTFGKAGQRKRISRAAFLEQRRQPKELKAC